MFRLYERIFSAFLLLVIISGSALPVSAAKPQKAYQPAPPQTLTASYISQNYIALKWTASPDKKISAYLIYMNSRYVDKATGTSYTVEGLSPNSVYSFSVKAQDQSGNISDPSNTFTALTLPYSAPIPTPVPTPTPSPLPVPSPSPTPQPTTPPDPSPNPKPVPTPKPVPSPINACSKIIAGYYAGWAAYSGYTPDDIVVQRLTHINYAFALIGDDLKITMGDSYIDPKNFQELKALKVVNPGLKTLITIGGWNGSANFSDAALTDASRNTFADSVVEFIVNNGFDGVDIDWEYPVSGGMAGNVSRSADKTNFTLLLAAMRKKLDAQGSVDGKDYLLSIAGGAGSSYCYNTELNKIASYVDYAIIMTYDIHGPWDTYTDLNAPLYSTSETSPQSKWSVVKSVVTWETKGFPASKIVVGVPFYGYVYTGATGGGIGLYQTFTNSSAVTFDKIISKYLPDSGYTQYTHADSKVPWLYNGSTFISYDDEASILLKGAYVNDRDLAGAAIWELSQNRSGELLKALADGLG